MSVTLTPPLKKGRYHVARFGFENVVGMVDASFVQKSLKSFLRQGLDMLVVNLRGAKDVDKAGWDCLVSTARRLQKSGGRVILRHCPDHLYCQLQVHHWDRVFLVPDRRADDAAALPVELREEQENDIPTDGATESNGSNGPIGPIGPIGPE